MKESIQHINLVDDAISYGQDNATDYIEARLVRTSGNQTILKNGNPEVGGLERNFGMGIRVLADGGMGFASTNTLTSQSVQKAIDFAIKMAKATGNRRKTPIEFSEESVEKSAYSSLGEQNKRPLDVDIKEKIGVLVSLDKMVQETKNKAAIPYRVFFLNDQTEDKYFLNSEGSEIESKIDRIQLFGILTAVNQSTGSMEQMMIQKGKTGGYEAFDYWGIEDFIVKKAKTLGDIVTEAKKAPTGTIDYVVGPNVIGIMCHENQGHPSEADRILGREGAQAGESYLNATMLGKKIGSEHVTIIDDPTLDGSYGYYLYDDEGVKARPRFLLAKGIFKEMLHNRESAAMMNTTSTAAARATAYDREPIPRMANTYLEPGNFTKEELIEDVKLGVLMLNFTEWNIDDRRYQSKYVGLESYLIENGQVKHLVRRPVIECTTPKLWGSVDGVAKRTELEFDAATCGKGEPMQGAPVYHGGSFMRMRALEVK